MPKRINMVNKRYGRLIVLSDRDDNGSLLGTTHARRVIAQCDCGVVRDFNARSMRRGNTISCGCAQIDSATTHGMNWHPLSSVWRTMNARCYSKKHRQYKNYGGRGIKVCKVWRDSLPKFIEWSELNGWATGLQIDRINNNKNYTPSNCRFVSAKINQNNRSDNRIIKHKGQSLTVSQAADKFGIPYDRLYQRIYKLNWDVEKALNHE